MQEAEASKRSSVPARVAVAPGIVRVLQFTRKLAGVQELYDGKGSEFCGRAVSTCVCGGYRKKMCMAYICAIRKIPQVYYYTFF